MAAILASLGGSTSGVALYSKFRKLPPTLEAEWAAFKAAHPTKLAHLANNAAMHHVAVAHFCKEVRRQGCRWAEYHALFDASREPYGSLYDQNRVPAGAVPRNATACARLHRPTAEELFAQVKRSEPAVLSGLMDGWPALERWTDEYLVARLGGVNVVTSVAEGRFDTPEAPARWGVADAEITHVVARPAHKMMPLAEAVRRFGENSAGLSHYIEYFPMEALAARDLRRDLRAPPPADAGGSGDGDGDGDGDDERGGPLPPPTPSDGVPELPTGAEPGSLAIADWLMPKKHLLWMGPGGTIGSTHYDPYENLMLMVAGEKTFFLAPPDDGPKLGAYTPMAQGQLDVVDDARGEAVGLRREAAAVGTPLTVHHYAAASLSTPADAQPHVPRLAEATVFNCTVRAGEVLYNPAYWWHEVLSAAPPGRGRPSVGINWFFEAYYQRVLPNMSWDRSLHYLMHGGTTPLRDPFPPRGAQPAAAATAAPAAGGGAPAAAAGRKPRSFAARLQEASGKSEL